VFWSGLWGVGGVEIPAGMALERVWQCDILKGKIQGGVSMETGLEYFNLLQSLQQAGTGKRVEEQ